MYTGPHIIKDGLVFGYDNGYNSSGKQIASDRFFKGPAHTNLVEEIDPSYGTTSSTNFFNNGGATEEVDIPQVGKRNVQYVEYFNNRYAADGSVNSGTTCCPNLFHYMADGAPYIPVDSSSSYTYSIIYKHTGGYHHPNFMYHYQKNSSNTTLTEGGVSSTSSDRRTHLGNGWYHAWGNIATQSTCTNVLLYSFLYNYGAVKHKYYVAAVSFVKNTTGETYLKIPPQLMLEPLGSVSNTASLIDLKETIDIDVSSMSFDSTGQPIFDGTDDILYANAENDYPYPYHSWEVWFKTNQVDSGGTAGLVGLDYGRTMYLTAANGGNIVYTLYSNMSSPNVLVLSISGGTNLLDNEWHQVVCSRGTSAAEIWVDGSLVKTASNGGQATWNGINQWSGMAARFGDNPNNSGLKFTGPIPIIKIYNKQLSGAEVLQNYNAQKSRFGL